jgi:pyruvate/2-oxoglutarate dehydrogenase complex dihydrolipoamide acyltransferase (E2) component
MAKITLKIPKLAVSMQEGTITEWMVKNGDVIAVGQTLYVIESEKTSFEVESPFAGTITLLAGEGDLMKVGMPVAQIET